MAEGGAVAQLELQRIGGLPHWKPEHYDFRAENLLSGAVVENDGSSFDREIVVLAFQWGFGFITEDGQASRNAVLVSPSDKVLFRILSSDVIHGFNIPVAGITSEIDPGSTSQIWIRAPEKPGKYLILA